MRNYIHDAVVRGLKDTKGHPLNPPYVAEHETVYQVLTGSTAYGVSSDTSDMDIISISMPVIEDIIQTPILGFDSTPTYFKTWQHHHIQDPDKRKEYDFSVYGLPFFFKLASECNPNIIDCLFVPDEYVLYHDKIGEMIRANRHLFLSKAAYPKFIGYSCSQYKKLKNGMKNGRKSESRQSDINEHGYDLKFAYHTARLLEEGIQILNEGDLDLQKSRKLLKSIRNGDWEFKDFDEYYNTTKSRISKAVENSDLPEKPRMGRIRNLLVECIEHRHGDMNTETSAEIYKEKLKQISLIVNK